MTATKRLGSEACKCLIYTCQASVQDYTCHICRLSGAEILLYASESLYVHCDRINVNTSKPVEVKISLCSYPKALDISHCSIYKRSGSERPAVTE